MCGAKVPVDEGRREVKLFNTPEHAVGPLPLSGFEQREYVLPELGAAAAIPVPPGHRVKAGDAQRTGTLDREAVQRGQEPAHVLPSPFADPCRRWRTSDLSVADTGAAITRDQVELRNRDWQLRGEFRQERDLAVKPVRHLGPPREAEYPCVVQVKDEAVPPVLDDAHLAKLQAGETRADKASWIVQGHRMPSSCYSGISAT